MNTWRFVDTGASTARYNMSVDQAILTAHAHGKCKPTLRIYQWNPPAISLGYFQRRHGINFEACQNLGIDTIRRPTGGRAVLHFGDLTYSVVAGVNDGMPASVAAAYQLICKGLMETFKLLGFEAQIRNSRGTPAQSDNCFLTKTAGDVLYKGKKFVGSAQTWYKSSMLQHGSIVLEPQSCFWVNLQGYGKSLCINNDILEHETTSIKEILGYIPEKGEIRNALLKGMSRTLGVEFEAGGLTGEELTLAEKIVKQYSQQSTTRSFQLIS